jgi:hypothetical protein
MFPDLVTRTSSRRWRWCTSASAPTRFRRGRWRIPTATSRTTARSTRCAATSTGCARARGCCARPCSATTCEGPAGHPPGGSDTATFDNVLECWSWPAVAAARRADDDPRAVERPREMDPAVRAFYEYHSSLMEPWDGPASIAFTDGTRHRRRARPQRPAPVALLRHEGRPRRHGVRGRACSTSRRRTSWQGAPAARARCSWSTPRRADHRRRGDQARAGGRAPLRRVARRQHLVDIEDLPAAARRAPGSRDRAPAAAGLRLHAGGPALLLAPMAARARSRSARWAPTRRWPCSRTGRGCSTTTSSSCSRRSPTRRSTRSARSWSRRWRRDDRPRAQPARAEPGACRQIKIEVPDPDNDQLAKLATCRRARRSARRRCRCSTTRRAGGGAGLERAMDALCRSARARRSPRATRHPDPLGPRRGRDHAPIPSLLATAGVHHHLVREGTRTRGGLVVESGDAREVHHVALLIGYGAGAVNPYLAFETLDDMIRQGLLPGVTDERPVNYVKALNKGVLKVMSKMGISTLQSYCGAQIFEAIGLERRSSTVLHRHAVAHRRHRPRRDRRGGAAAPRARLPRPPDAGAPTSSTGRRVPVAARRRVPPVQPRHGVQAAARDAHRAVRDLQGVHALVTTRAPARTLRGLFRAEAGRGRRAARRGRAGRAPS